MKYFLIFLCGFLFCGLAFLVYMGNLFLGGLNVAGSVISSGYQVMYGDRSSSPR